jgi:Cytochrome c554 and c-prime
VVAGGKLLSCGRFPAAALLGLALSFATPSALANEIGFHEGVATCGGSTCHGRLAPTGRVVRQNELITWQDESSPSGAHSRAWQALTKVRGEAIASRLGLGAAERAQTCLGCHSDDVPAEKRGARFQISDGVGCESCHGGAGGWLSSHYAVGATHAANLAQGMKALDNAKARASVCLDCHFGANKPGYVMTHRIMAAGHPRISFELDLFGALQSHYDFDADYAQRKPIPGGVKLWAVGQAMALDRVLSGFAERQEGMFPDFYFYDCQSCHRPLTDTRTPQVNAVSNPDRRIPQGTPVFDDENMIMLEAAVDTAAPGLAARFKSDSQSFHAALARDRSSAADAAATLAATARALADAFSAHTFGRDESFAILDHLLNGAVTARYTDYTGGAQAVMGIDTLLNALVTAGYVQRSSESALRPDIDTLYRNVRDPNAYRSQEFRDALARVASAIRRLR